MDDGRIRDVTSDSRGGAPRARAQSGHAAACVRELGQPSAGRPQHCPLCGSDLVYPTDWRQVDASSWELELRCPECGTVRAVSLDREAMHGFNVLLYRSAEQLAREAEQLTQECAANDEACCRAFVAALRGISSSRWTSEARPDTPPPFRAALSLAPQPLLRDCSRRPAGLHWPEGCLYTG